MGCSLTRIENPNHEVVAVDHKILERKPATLQVADFVSRQLPLPLLPPISEIVAVIL
jgi:hypothetical protein